MKMAGKKVIVLGERDGVPDVSLAECVRSAGGEVIYANTVCTV